MIAFIFGMLDHDKDQRITKVDMLRFSAIIRGGKKINTNLINLYPENVGTNIALYKFDRGDEIDLIAFTKCALAIPYFVFPGFRLQEQIRETFGGENLWQAIWVKIQEQEKADKI
jgi:hypothetical protein